MKLDDLIHVSGLPGLYKVAATRSNGIIIEDLDTGKSKFAPMRKHQFTPLGTVAIYTNSGTTELIKVFQSMSENEKTLPIPDPKSSAEEVFDYFGKIVPDYDRYQVLVSDVKKVIKWYSFLKTRSILTFDAEGRSSEEE